jgi:hypothetical protein
MEMNTSRDKQVRKIGYSIFFILLCSYCYFTQPPSNSNSVARISLALAIIEDGSLKIDRFQKATSDKVFFKGHYYPDKAPGLSFAALPFTATVYKFIRLFDNDIRWIKIDPDKSRVRLTSKFKFITYVSTIITSGLMTAITGTVLYFLALRLGANITGAIYATLTFGLATPAWGWATAFFGHAMTGSCLFMAFAAICYLKQSPPKKLRDTLFGFFIGALLAWAIVIEYPSIISSTIIAAFGIITILPWERRRIVPVLVSAIVGSVIFIIPLLLYNAIAFDSPFHVGYQEHQIFEGHKQGIVGITYPKLNVLYKILFSQYRGIFWLSPILIIFPFAFYRQLRLLKLRNITVTAMIIIAYYLLFNSAYYYWDGVWSTGPRYITPMLPFVCLPIALLWTQADSRFKTALLCLFSFSFLISLICVSVTMASPSKYANPLFDFLIPEFLTGRIRTILNLFSNMHLGLLTLLPLLLIQGLGILYIVRILKTTKLKRVANIVGFDNNA